LASAPSVQMGTNTNADRAAEQTDAA